jgi:hypothetical protein
VPKPVEPKRSLKLVKVLDAEATPFSGMSANLPIN